MSKIFALLGFLIAAYLLSLPALFLDPVALINGNSSTMPIICGAPMTSPCLLRIS